MAYKNKIDLIKWRERNRERLREYDKQRNKRPERIAQMKEYSKKDWKRKKNDLRYKEKRREYYKTESYRKSSRKSYLKRREKAIEHQKGYYKKNREKILIYLRIYRENNRDYIKQLNRDYGKTKPGKLRQLKVNLKRRQANRGSPFILTRHKLIQIGLRDKICVYCGNDSYMSYDHIIPISKGGNSNYNNLVLCCCLCNSKKGNKNVLRWCAEEKIPVPAIVVELLKKQKVQNKIDMEVA